MRLGVVHHGAQHVSGQQIRCKLNAAEAGVDSLCQGFNSKGFCQTGYTLKQYMTPGKQTYQQALGHEALTHNSLIHLHHEQLDKSALCMNTLIKCADVRSSAGSRLHFHIEPKVKGGWYVCVL